MNPKTDGVPFIMVLQSQRVIPICIRHGELAYLNLRNNYSCYSLPERAVGPDHKS